MKKKKARRRKGVSKKSHVMSAASISKEKKAVRVSISEQGVLPPTPLKKDGYKKVENNVFALKRYFIVARQFLADAKVELKKVTWPTRKELLSITAVVVILVLLIAFYLGIVDLGLVKMIKNVIG